MTAILFGAKAQVVIGAVFALLTASQWAWWTFGSPPSVNAVFQVSMEALLFASYAVIATGLGYRATERVEATVVENIGQADVEADEVHVHE